MKKKITYILLGLISTAGVLYGAIALMLLTTLWILGGPILLILLVWIVKLFNRLYRLGDRTDVYLALAGSVLLGVAGIITNNIADKRGLEFVNPETYKLVIPLVVVGALLLLFVHKKTELIAEDMPSQHEEADNNVMSQNRILAKIKPYLSRTSTWITIFIIIVILINYYFNF